MFRVGQKVMCVDASGTFGHLEQDRVYTCVGIEPGWIGVDCCSRCSDIMHRWLPPRFRPILERKTDISIFTALLNTKKMREPANG